MEFIIPSSLAGIIAAGLLVLFVATQVIIDSFDISTTKRLYRRLVQVGKDHSQKSFTIVVTLRKKTTTILPLLEHIYSQDYQKMQVLVILKHTAGKHAQSELRSMRRKNKWQGMRIISYKKGQSDQDIVRRYAKEDVTIELLPDSRMTPGFFDDISYALLLNPQDIIVPKQQHQLDTSLTSAFAAHFELWASLVAKKTARVATIITPAQPFTGRSFAMVSIQAIIKRLSLVKVVVGVTLVTIIGIALSQLLEQGDIMTLVAIILVAYVVIYSINMLRQRGRSILDRISLILLSPFALIYGVILVICAVAIYTSGLFRLIGRQLQQVK